MQCTHSAMNTTMDMNLLSVFHFQTSTKGPCLNTLRVACKIQSEVELPRSKLNKVGNLHVNCQYSSYEVHPNQRI